MLDCEKVKRKLAEFKLVKRNFDKVFESLDRSADFEYTGRLKRVLEDIIHEIRQGLEFDSYYVFNQFIKAVLDPEKMYNYPNSHEDELRHYYSQGFEFDKDARTITIKMGSIDLSGRDWEFEFPEGMIFDFQGMGVLSLQNSGIKKLPNRFKVLGGLDIQGTNITELPDDLRVFGTLFINKKLREQAKVLKIKGQVDDYQVK